MSKVFTKLRFSVIALALVVLASIISVPTSAATTKSFDFATIGDVLPTNTSDASYSINDKLCRARSESSFIQSSERVAWVGMQYTHSGPSSIPATVSMSGAYNGELTTGGANASGSCEAGVNIEFIVINNNLSTTYSDTIFSKVNSHNDPAPNNCTRIKVSKLIN